MPVLALELALSLARGGGPGNLEQTGAHSGAKKTSVGLEASVSNQQTSSYTGTTLASSMAGTSADTTTMQLTLFSRVSMLSLIQLSTLIPSCLVTSPALTTLLTHHPEESTAPPIFSYHSWSFLSMLRTSSLMPPTPSQCHIHDFT